MRVCFSIDNTGFEAELRDWLLIAIRSVIKNTKLQPVVLCPEIQLERLSVFKAAGAEIRYVRSRLLPSIKLLSEQRQIPPWMEGALLRYEAPSLFPEEDFIICVDCDTYFLREPKIDARAIDIVGAAKSSLHNGEAAYNSGVLVFNVKNFLLMQERFFLFLENTLGSWLPHSIDQMAFNEFFAKKITSLNHELNWLVSFGYNRDAEIVHFQSIRFQYAEWLMQGDYRGFQKDLLSSGYIHEYARHVSASIHTALTYLRDIEEVLHGTAIGEQARRFSAHADEKSLIEAVMSSRAEAGAARAQALAAAADFPIQYKPAHRFTYDGGHRDAVSFLVFPCKDFGFGRLLIRYESADDAEGIQILNNSSLMIECTRPDRTSIHCIWAGIGVDCHFLLTARGVMIGSRRFTVESIGIGSTKLVVYAVEGENNILLTSE